jgi:hypothetical protein
MEGIAVGQGGTILPPRGPTRPLRRVRRAGYAAWPMAGPPLRGVYLRPLPDALVPARHSAGARRRAGQLQAFLRPLQALAAERLPLHGELTLSVLGADDWRRAYRYPYGFPFTRTRPTPASLASAGGPHVDVIVPADHPARLVRRFDEVLLRAARSGVRPPPAGGTGAEGGAADGRAGPSDPAALDPGLPLRGPGLSESPAPSGDVHELLDLIVGHEWGHAVAALAGLRLRVTWLDELLATVIYLAALRDVGADAVAGRVVAWADLQAAGGDDSRRDLGAFEYPRGRLRFAQSTYFQGVFTRRAWDLVAGEHASGRPGGDTREPWAFVQALHAAVAPVASAGGRHRGDVARALVEVEPSFRPWFATFGERSGADQSGADQSAAERDEAEQVGTERSGVERA